MSIDANTGNAPTWTVGDRLRKAREVAGYSQLDLAERVGIGRRSVTNYESGTQTPKRPVLVSWALATGVPLPWILTGIESEHGDGPGCGDVVTYFGAFRSKRASARRWSGQVTPLPVAA